jgi:Ca-activated chloride channel family protein
MLLSLPSTSRVNSLLPSTPAGASAGAELVTTDGRLVPLVGARLVGEAQGGIARLVLEQQFANRYAETLNVTYRMPLPADGAISGYEFVIGERTIKGTIDKKRRARERFERAIASGHTAALLEQERADIFTQQIGNIPSGESITARITIDQRLVWLPEGEWELRFPTVIGPRYIGAADSAADVRATHIKVTEQPLSARITVAIDVKDAITGGAKPSLPAGALRLDRDIVMRWPVAQPTPGITLAAARGAQGAFGLLTIVPPSPTVKPTPVPRDLIVLLDTSGSMGGGPLDKAKQVVAMMLDSLHEQDRFELIEFNNSPARYNPEPLTATPQAKQAAIRWVRSRHADGGTEMRAGVIEAMQSLRVGAQRQIVIVTDGYVGGEQQILEAINRRLPRSARLHVLGVGSAVNRSLATALSRAGRGVEVIIDVDEDAERGAKRLLDRTSTPLLTNVEITGSAVMRHAPDRIPDVFERAPLVAALMLRPDGGQLVVRGQLGTETWEQTLEVPPVTAASDATWSRAIAALYGRERVADVEANALFSSVDGEVEELGLVFQIATRMTSWVAVDETRKVTGPTRDELVPQELPYGTRASSFGLRGAAAGAAMQLESATMALAEEADFDDEARFDRSVSLNKSMRYDVGESFDEAFGDEEPTGAGGPPAPAAPAAPRQQAMVTRAGVVKEFAKQAKLEEQEKLEPDDLVAAPRQEPLAAAPRKAMVTHAEAPDTRTRPAEAKPTRAAATSMWPWLAAIIAIVIALLVWWLLA